MMTFWSYLPVLKQLADIAAALTFGTILGVALLVAAWFLPVFRQFLIGLAVAAFVGTFLLGYGVNMEREVCAAQQVRAEKLRQERDKLQNKLASDDAARLQAGLEELNRAEDEAEEDYAKRLAARKDGSCALTDDDLR